MRRADITVGKDYGFTESPGKNRTEKLLRARRCTVLQTGCVRPVRWPKVRHDGVRVVSQGIDLLLSSREIIAPWAECRYAKPRAASRESNP